MIWASNCAANQMHLSALGQFAHIKYTFREKTAYIYVNYCHGKKRLILQDQCCLPHAALVKYLAFPQSWHGALKISVTTRPDFPIIRAAY